MAVKEPPVDIIKEVVNPYEGKALCRELKSSPEHPAVGRELDLALAREGIGVTRVYVPHCNDTAPDWDGLFVYWIPGNKPWRTHAIEAQVVPRFSTDNAAAFAGLVQLQESGWAVTVEGDGSGWRTMAEGRSTVLHGEGDTAAEAISRLLLAVIRAKAAQKAG